MIVFKFTLKDFFLIGLLFLLASIFVLYSFVRICNKIGENRFKTVIPSFRFFFIVSI